jgi:hypothetical protein
MLVHERRMASPRLSDSQKQELVARYRTGETASALALAYGCSANTISRVVKSTLDPEELALLRKQPRGGGASKPERPVSSGDAPQVTAGVEGSGTASADAEPQPGSGLMSSEIQVAERQPAGDDADSLPGDAARMAEGVSTANAPASSLAIDDADDFGDDSDDFGDDAEEEEDSDDDFDVPPSTSFPDVSGTHALPSDAESSAVTLAPLQPLPLVPGVLPTSLYLLVDKTVELETRPLRDFSELGPLPQDEQDRQALMLFVNPRQAKRQCGRSQRVIKLPDSTVLQRTAPYLVAQGITRLVLEGGSLFAVPGT